MTKLTWDRVFWWLAKATWKLSGHRYTLVRIFNKKHRPRLLLQGCQCDGTSHALHRRPRPTRLARSSS